MFIKILFIISVIVWIGTVLNVFKPLTKKQEEVSRDRRIIYMLMVCLIINCLAIIN